MTPAVSVVIRTRDEADRLRLALSSLHGQSALEVVVVDDGSTDHTPEVLEAAAHRLPVRIIRHGEAKGRSAASNAGARVARGNVIVFMDGDTLAGPGLVARHAALHSAHAHALGRGENLHMRGTRFLLDPARATPRPGEEQRIAALPAQELRRMQVTLEDVEHDFAGIEARASPGVYPGVGPRRLCEVEMDALCHYPECAVLWAAAAGSNFSVPADDFHRSGGFLDALEINEHRELALRLCKAGARMHPVNGARSFHLTHRSGWRDPLQDDRWQAIFERAHPIPEVQLLPLLWACVGGAWPAPRRPRIESLPELELAARRDDIDVEAIRATMRRESRRDASCDDATVVRAEAP